MSAIEILNILQKNCKMKVLELFSGIGGMHFAAEIANKSLPSECQLSVVAAMDINTVSNDVYRLNHPGTLCSQRNITGLTTEYLRS